MGSLSFLTNQKKSLTNAMEQSKKKDNKNKATNE